MKKFNYKNYLLLILVFVTSFFAFNANVKAQDRVFNVKVNANEEKQIDGLYSSKVKNCQNAMEGIGSGYASLDMSQTYVKVKGLSQGSTKFTCTVDATSGTGTEKAYINVEVGFAVKEEEVKTQTASVKVKEGKKEKVKTTDGYFPNSSELTNCVNTNSNVADFVKGGSLVYIEGKKAGNTQITCNRKSGGVIKIDVTVQGMIDATIEVKKGTEFSMPGLISEKTGLKWCKTPFCDGFDNGIMTDENYNLVSFNGVITRVDDSVYFTATNVGSVTGYVFHNGNKAAKVTFVVKDDANSGSGASEEPSTTVPSQKVVLSVGTSYPLPGADTISYQCSVSDALSFSNGKITALKSGLNNCLVKTKNKNYIVTTMAPYSQNVYVPAEIGKTASITLSEASDISISPDNVCNGLYTVTNNGGKIVFTSKANNGSSSCNVSISYSKKIGSVDYRLITNYSIKNNGLESNIINVELQPGETQTFTILGATTGSMVANTCASRATVTLRGDQLTVKANRSGTCSVGIQVGNNSYKTVSIKINGNATGGGNYSNAIEEPEENYDSIKGKLDQNGLCDTFVVKPNQKFSPNHEVVAKYNANGNYEHKLYLYQADDKCNNNSYTAICYDPRLKNPGNAGKIYDPVAYVNPFDDIDAFTQSGSGANSAAIEAFALSMIQSHYPDIIGTVKGRMAAQIAIRTYIYGNHNASSGGAETYYRQLFCGWTGSCDGMIWTGKDFLYPDSGSTGAATAESVLSMAKLWWSESSVIGDVCIKKENCKENDKLKNIGYDIVFNKNTNACDTATTGNKRTYTITGTIYGLNNYNDNYVVGGQNYSPKITLSEFTCPSGLSCKVYVGNREINVGVENNLKGFGNRETIKIVIEGDICSADLDGMFDLKIKSMHPADWRNIVTLKPRTGNYQRMFLIKEAGETTSTFKPVGDPEAMKELCNCNMCKYDPNREPTAFKNHCCTLPSSDLTEEQQKFLKNHPNFCNTDPCGDVKWDVYCGPTEKLNYHIKEGWDTSTDSYNYKKCVVDKGKDKAGNTFKEKEISYGSSKYCTIYCAEDWEMELPGYLKNVYAGTGFDLAIGKVEGKRTCFTSKINTDEFIKNFKDANTNVISAFNDYVRAKALVDAFNSAPSSSVTKSATVDIPDSYSYYVKEGDKKHSISTCTDGETKKYKIDSKDIEGTCVKEQDTRTCSKAITIKTVPNITYKKYAYDNSTNAISSTDQSETGGEFGSISWSTNTQSNPCGGESSNSAEADFIRRFFPGKSGSLDSILESYRSAYNSKVEERDKIMNLYQSCTKSIEDMTYEWNPLISYTYADSEMMNKLTNGSNIFVEEEGTHTEVNTNKYFSASDGNVEKTFEGGSDNSYTTLIHGPSGDVSGTPSISTQDWTVTNNTYVKKEILESGSFNIKGSFFVENNTGYVSYKENENGNREYEQPLIGKYWNSYYHTDSKVVPVSTTLPAGKYEYQLKFEHIGQYNGGEKRNDNDPRGRGGKGRIVGGTDGAGTDSVLKASKISNTTSTTETCYFEIIAGELCPCCGKDVDVTVVSLDSCAFGNCGKKPGDYLSPNADLGYYARAVSLNDINPNNRQLGSVWGGAAPAGETVGEWKAQSIAKGQATKTEIEAGGNTAYETPDYSYTITPTGIVSIKNSTTNYSDNTLQCKNGIDCTSLFLDEIDKLSGVTENKRVSDFKHYSASGRELSWK